ncbi:hypothetical protein DL546_008997 [Coniochaeta pulveracea]|uniref:Extracellular membrane protein CFEM domain-containing protein n=1 Tax=Coniochaeta pulveracea TaxID=177199 RepID=A0A420YJS8_9PEZI|nr:hypothetical protein DL546_008997 [Coniochaeta pulveracea]
MARTRSIRRTVANFFVLFSPAAATVITLSNFQHLPSDSSINIICRAAYSTPLFRCTNADFSSGQTCSKHCITDIENAESAIQFACQDVDIDPSTLLGQAQESELVDRLCPGTGTGTGTATGGGVATTTSTSMVTSTRTIGSFSAIPTPSTLRTTTTSTTNSVEESGTTVASSESTRTSTVVVETTTSSEGTTKPTTTAAQTQSETDTLTATSTETVETTSTTDAVTTTAQPTSTFTSVHTSGASRTSTSTQNPGAEPTTGGGSPFDTGNVSSGSRHVVRGWFEVLPLVLPIFLLLR